MSVNSDFVKLAVIVVGAIGLFMVLNKYQILPYEGYDALSAIPSTLPVAGTQAPVGMVQTGNQIMPTSAPPLAPVQATSTQMGPMDPSFQPQPADDRANMAPVLGAWNKPKDCYPKATLGAEDLLPKDQYSTWNLTNPEGSGDLANKNFLSAGFNNGLDTTGGNSIRNQSYDLRGNPAPCPQVSVSPWLNSTIMPEVGRRQFEIGGNC